jgi:hypothetical protein
MKNEKKAIFMTYKGVVKGKVIELKDDVTLPEGTCVSVIPEEPVTVSVPEHPMTLKEWLQEARQVRAQLPKTSDSVEILRQLREGRASR